MISGHPISSPKQKADLRVRLFSCRLRNLFVALATLLATTAPVCGEDWRLLTFTEPHMGTEFTIRAWTQEGREADLTLSIRESFARVAALDRALSDYRPESEINQLAKAPAHEAVTVSEDLFAVFTAAGAITEESGGAFDITAGPLIRLWRMSRKNDALPSPERIAAAKARTGFHHLVLDPDKRTLTKNIDGMLFDVGGIAKGFAADAALAVLKRDGFPRALVAASGDIVVGEAPPDQAGWKVGIETLELGHDLKDLQTVTLVNQAISTSGDTRRFFEHDGVRYSHIVSTTTGLGLTERIGASVIAADATTSDACATAVTLLGAKEGLQFIRNKRRIECQIVVLRDGHEAFLRSDGFPSPPGPQTQKESAVASP